MKRERRKFTNSFKTEVVLEALKEKQTTSELAQRYKLLPNQIAIWKKEFLSNANLVFGGDSSEINNDKAAKERLEEDLYSQIGRLKMENEWLKKKLA